ncbi:RING-type domain-containing protein [Mycena venus]|uniref:RING-type domain-containing protein n=1 Tax=Mycena venus TaxID=2733690 RepID=A0A8H6XBF2_9AGAR|nr:RING-type domain-containing protein [Mycena venus]
MSNVSSAPAEFDFWEFVSCSRCHLPFASGSGATVPFWLTECGHVVCNTHLNIDQSCAQCGMTNIQLVPLQREMEAPMSEWFRSIPHALDTVAYAAKFQQETMAFQIRYYKAKQQQQRGLIDRLKRETAELKKINDILANENAQFRQHLGYQDGRDGEPEPSDDLNQNGKRPMNDADQYRPRTSSSRSTVTPLGPNRLTLPPGQQPPSLSSNRPEDPTPRTHSHSRAPPKAAQRPGSSRFLEQYSYIPPSTQFHPQPLSHSQAAPRRAKQNQNEQPSQVPPRGTVPPPRFKPAHGAPASSNKANGAGRPSLQNQAMHHDSRQRNMEPPPTPQQARQPTDAPLPSSRRANASLPSDNRSLPPNQRFAPPAPVNPQRFMPSTSNGAPQRFPAGGGAGSRGPLATGASSRAVMNNLSGGGQRVPFVPHASGGFG